MRNEGCEVGDQQETISVMDKPFHKCRLCLKLGEFCSIFEQDESIKLSEMVMSFANIQIFPGDGLTDRVCSSCLENLSTAYLFKLQCERINEILRKSPDENINKLPNFEYNIFMDKEFHMHAAKSMEGENVQNVIKEEGHNGASLEVSDETDSDVDSVICVYCNESHGNLGAHTCRVTCNIEHNVLQQSSSSETLVATDVTSSDTDRLITTTPEKPPRLLVTCVLCDEKFNQYDAYVMHFNNCTLNVKLHHIVCPICHDIHTEKLAYLEHLRVIHFKYDHPVIDSDIDCVDIVPPVVEKTRRPIAVRRQIGWSIEDIYQEIDCKKIEDNQTPNSSPLKSLNATFSNHSTPKKVSFRKFFETSKAKTSNYLPFRKYIQSYRQKKKINDYSPIKDKLQVTGKLKACWHEEMSDTDYNSPSGTSEESWKLKQNLICTCNKSVFMLSEFINDRDRITAMINELGGVVAENTKMEMLATHFISVLPNDTFTGMMVCALSTGKWLLHVNYIYDSFRSKKFLNENMYEWMKHPKILEIDNTSVEVAKAAVYWHLELQALSSKFPFEGKQIVLIMKKKYRQYYQMIFKTLKAKPITYDPRTPGSCCTADYCFVDMKVIQRVKLRFFARHNVPVFPYQYILVYLLNRGRVEDEHKYLLQEYQKIQSEDTVDLFNNTY